MDNKVFFALMVLVFVGLCGKGWAADDTSCISSLTPCSNDLNSTGTPAKDCCNGLLDVIAKDPQCLCGLLKSDMVKQLGINMTKAMELPARCGKNVTADQCSKTSSGGSSSSAPPKATPSGGSSSSSSSSSTTGTKGDSNMASPGAVFSVLPMAVLIMVVVSSHLVFGEFSTNVHLA